MKKLTLCVAVLLASLLAGCVVYPVPYDHGRGYRYHDRDGDGVRDRLDRRPNNPRQY